MPEIEKLATAVSSPRRKFDRYRRDPLPYGMIIVPKFELKYNEETEKYSIIVEKADTATGCPLCEGFLKYRDAINRDVIDRFGEVWHFNLRRLRCMLCKKLHREIPDTIQPFKRYNSEAIQCALDGNEDALECDVDASTIRRWKAEFTKAEPDIEQRLASAYARELDEKVPVLSSTTILAYIQAAVERWLAFVMVLLINSGHKLCTQFAFCPPHPCAKLQNAGNNLDGGCKSDGKTYEDTG